MKDNFLTTKTKYNIISYPNFLFIFFDLEYKKLLINKDKIIMLSEKNFVLGYDISYSEDLFKFGIPHILIYKKD